MECFGPPTSGRHLGICAENGLKVFPPSRPEVGGPSRTIAFLENSTTKIIMRTTKVFAPGWELKTFGCSWVGGTVLSI